MVSLLDTQQEQCASLWERGPLFDLPGAGNGTNTAACAFSRLTMPLYNGTNTLRCHLHSQPVKYASSSMLSAPRIWGHQMISWGLATRHRCHLHTQPAETSVHSMVSAPMIWGHQMISLGLTRATGQLSGVGDII